MLKVQILDISSIYNMTLRFRISLKEGFIFIWQRLDVDIIVAAVLTFSKKQFGEVRELGPCLPSSRSEKMNI